VQRRQWPVKRSWVVVGCLVILAACGAPIDERARVAGVLQDGSPPPPIVVAREATAAPRTLIVTPPGPIAMTPLAPRPTEAVPPRRLAARTATPPAPTAVEKPAPADVKMVVPLFEPARLVGLGRSELADLMGTPEILRNEPPGEVWLYKSGACVAHVYLYQQAGPDDYHVSYVETRGVGAAVSSAQCLAHLASGSASAVSLSESQN
jgi:hypothetical protein